MWSRGQRLQHGHRYSCLQASKKTNDRVDLFRSNHDDAADLGWRSSFGNAVSITLCMPIYAVWEPRKEIFVAYRPTREQEQSDLQA